MEGKLGAQVSVSEHCDDGGGGSPETRPPLRDTIDELRDSFSSWTASFAAKLDSAAADVHARAKVLTKELGRKRKEPEKEIEAVDRKSAAIELLRKEIAELRKQPRSVGSCSAEAELEEKRRGVEAREKEIGECYHRFRLMEKGLKEQLAEFQVRSSELKSKERGIAERERRCREIESNAKRCAELRAKEKEFELRVVEFNRRVVKPDLRLVELSKKERELEGKEKRSKELELKLLESLTELKMKEKLLMDKENVIKMKEKVLMDKESVLDERVKDVELKEKKLEEERLRELDAEEGEISAEGVVDDSQLKEKRGEEEVCRESELKEDEKLVKSVASVQYSGAKRSWSDASGNGDHTESADPVPGMSVNLPAEQPETSNVPARQLERVNEAVQQPERLNIPVQQPGRLSIPDQQPERLNAPVQCPETLFGDQAGCSNPFPINSKHSGSRNETDPLPSETLLVHCILGCTRLKPLCRKIETNTLHCSEISDALELASDPGEFVLGVVKDPSSLTLKRGNEVVKLASPEYGPLLLLDRMWRMSPHIKPDVEREALSFARKWRSKLPKLMDYRLEPVCFLLFLAAYKLVSHFSQDEIFSVFGKGHWCAYATKLFGVLGFKDLIPKFLEYLMRNKLLMETLTSVNESSLLEKSPSAKTLLKKYLLPSPKKLRGTESIGQKIEAIYKELDVWKAVVESIEEQNLSVNFRAHILSLEKQKEEKLQALHRSEAIAGAPPTPKLSENQQPGRQQQQDTPAASPKAEQQHDAPPASSKVEQQHGTPPATSKADADPITTSAASSSPPVAQDETRAQKKRRRVVKPLNALQRAPPLGSNSQKVHPPQQPLQFLGGGGGLFRPAAPVVYSNAPFRFPVLTFPWPQQTPFGYPGHRSFLQTGHDPALPRGPDDASGAPGVEALPSAEASVSIAQTGGESASPSSGLQVGLSAHWFRPSEAGSLTENLVGNFPRPFSLGLKHQITPVFSSFAEAKTAPSSVASAPPCLATQFGHPNLSKCTADSPASTLVLAEKVKETGANPSQPEE